MPFNTEILKEFYDFKEALFAKMIFIWMENLPTRDFLIWTEFFFTKTEFFFTKTELFHFRWNLFQFRQS